MDDFITASQKQVVQPCDACCGQKDLSPLSEGAAVSRENTNRMYELVACQKQAVQVVIASQCKGLCWVLCSQKCTRRIVESKKIDEGQVSQDHVVCNLVLACHLDVRSCIAFFMPGSLLSMTCASSTS